MSGIIGDRRTVWLLFAGVGFVIALLKVSLGWSTTEVVVPSYVENCWGAGTALLIHWMANRGRE